VDVVPSGASSFEVGDLQQGATYSFGIMAHNAIGESKYTVDIVRVETKSEFSSSALHW
jgi:hypothetical protein